MAALFASRSLPVRLFSKVGRRPVSSRADVLDSFPATEMTALTNGVRVASENHGTATCTVGIYLDVGSRFDTAETSGVSHFLEHMSFKGTGKRSREDIEKQIIERGARVRSSSSRELSTLTSECLVKDLPWAIELLSEVATNTTFAEPVVTEQKAVVQREMQEMEHDFKTVVMDYLHATAYQGTPLARPVIGEPETVAGISSQSLSDFVKQHYAPSRIVLSVAGGVDHGTVVELANKHLSQWALASPKVEPRQAIRFTGSEIRDRDDAYPFAHIAFAVEGPGWASADTVPLRVAAAISGNWNRTVGGGQYSANKLAKHYTEHGVIHSYESIFQCYHDTSLWGMYCVSERMHQDHETKEIFKEWMRISTSATQFEVDRVKNQLRTALLAKFAEGGNWHACNEMGRHILAYDRRIPLKEMIYRINSVDAESVRDAGYKYLYDNCIAVAAFGPIEALEHYDRLRNHLYKMAT